MPELPEVETICQGLNQLTLNHRIQGSEVLLQRSLAYPDNIADFQEGITGKTLNKWTRRGKYLLAKLDDNSHLGIHLRMTGQLLWVKHDQECHKHTRIRIYFENNQELRFVDTRTFGKVWWIPKDVTPENIITGLKLLGVEPLSDDFTPDYLIKKLAKRERAIKTVLLDQSVIAGIGNIYADESLFKSGIYPDTPANKLTEKQIKALHEAIVTILQTAIAKGGTTFSDFLNILGVNGNYGGVAWVYRRTGEPCRVCGTKISKIKLGGRSTHYCTICNGKSV